MTALPSAAAASPARGESQVGLPRGRRRTELAMLGFAVAIVACAYLSAGLGLNGKIPSGLAVYVLGFAALMVAAHLAIWRLAPWADPLMLPLAALLNGLGIVMIYRLQESGRSGNPGLQISTLTTHAAAYQLMWTGVGVIAFIVALVMIRELRPTAITLDTTTELQADRTRRGAGLRLLRRYTYTLGTVGLILLAIPAVLPSSMSSVNGAKVWIIVGGFSIQPGEFARIALAVFFAGYLLPRQGALSLTGRRVFGLDLPRPRHLIPVLAIWGASLLILFFESDIGTSALFFGLFVSMLYIATQRTSWLLIGFGLFLGGSYLADKIVPHVHERFVIWLQPFAGTNATGSAFQLVQGLEGMAFGGIFGTGLGQGQPFHTPLVQSDFIMTGFGEELGLTGMMALLLIFGLLAQRGLRAAIVVRDPFAKLLAGGLSFVLALQVFIIVGGVTQLIPLTGITTPFLSQGGSSLVASWIVIALLIRVSDIGRRPAPQPYQDEGMTQVVRAG